ncbi:hypothetical protein DICSQDRAFT_144412 [Dichomitus squalens LYAD-421 SS1]|uniref:uncharacterized protein n=1 Tax=Dichomitus squalens (strain LYAD-421) TaxID=732165 RepID=UPI00044111F5|nr:uncharacterized protein DICSQDRAFT_144412 [Dichomitus squalens LYAD-421 SS1]EJF64660.1 hypothetical protein DICSQDRAFT_144412 [Dichomitus squalens LYAD-421 SS1]
MFVTDTKNVWGEVLSSNQFARRWREYNPQYSLSFPGEGEEQAWRTKCLEFLSAAHSLGGLAELSFETTKSNYSDLAFTLGNDSFRWRWEAFAVGPKLSADILSKHLILPLISMAHLAFSSADPLTIISETDLEKTVDKVGRSARRTLDTHVRNALSRPLLATTLQRMSAVFNFVPDLPRIAANSETPDLTPPVPPATSQGPSASKPLVRRAPSSSPPLPTNRAGPSNQAKPHSQAGGARQVVPTPPPPDDDSVTEEEPEEEDYGAVSGKDEAAVHDRRNSSVRNSSPVLSVPSKRATPEQSPPSKTGASVNHSPQPQSSSPLPAPKTKRVKAAVSSSDEEDSEEERRKRLARLKGSVAARGPKQPLKRGGRRF